MSEVFDAFATFTAFVEGDKNEAKDESSADEVHSVSELFELVSNFLNVNFFLDILNELVVFTFINPIIDPKAII